MASVIHRRLLARSCCSHCVNRFNAFSTSRRLLANTSLPPRPKVDEADLEEHFLKGSGPGGQKINKTNSAVQLIHKPTGIVTKCQATRSREQNRKIARRNLAEMLERIDKGDESRSAIKAERARTKKASADKKKRRKYRELNETEAETETNNESKEQGEPQQDTSTAATESAIVRFNIRDWLEQESRTLQEGARALRQAVTWRVAEKLDSLTSTMDRKAHEHLEKLEQAYKNMELLAKRDPERFEPELRRMKQALDRAKEMVDRHDQSRFTLLCLPLQQLSLIAHPHYKVGLIRIYTTSTIEILSPVVRIWGYIRGILDRIKHIRDEHQRKLDQDLDAQIENLESLIRTDITWKPMLEKLKRLRESRDKWNARVEREEMEKQRQKNRRKRPSHHGRFDAQMKLE